MKPHRAEAVADPVGAATGLADRAEKVAVLAHGPRAEAITLVDVSKLLPTSSLVSGIWLEPDTKYDKGWITLVRFLRLVPAGEDAEARVSAR